MSRFLIIWGGALILLLFIAIYFMVNGSGIASGLLYENFIIQVILFLIVLFLKNILKKKVKTRSISHK
ncbi:hypothetical protein [Myroides guanonis]|uniref:Uncharacterized protein n=1 Tax=Myroides guanonis TaxID=1150112 RepID=A0A1I3PET2_9FLAO|nr:hypothetical protein [Myroides guanonis]SFJ20164.1 hypothetical protein SAMN04487893_104102 [Myroides guanonis]